MQKAVHCTVCRHAWFYNRDCDCACEFNGLPCDKYDMLYRRVKELPEGCSCPGCVEEDRVCGEHNFIHEYGRSFCRIYKGTLWIYADFKYDQITVPDDIDEITGWRSVYAMSELNSACFAQACETMMGQAGQWFHSRPRGYNAFMDSLAGAMVAGEMPMDGNERGCLESVMFTWNGCNFFIPPEKR